MHYEIKQTLNTVVKLIALQSILLPFLNKRSQTNNLIGAGIPKQPAALVSVLQGSGNATESSSRIQLKTTLGTPKRRQHSALLYVG